MRKLDGAFTRLLRENGGSSTDNIPRCGAQARAAALGADDAGRASSAFDINAGTDEITILRSRICQANNRSRNRQRGDALPITRSRLRAHATSRVREYSPMRFDGFPGTLGLDAKDSTVAYPLDFSSSCAAGGQVGLLYPTAEASMIQGGSSSTDAVNPPVDGLRTFTSEFATSFRPIQQSPNPYRASPSHPGFRVLLSVHQRGSRFIYFGEHLMRFFLDLEEHNGS